MPFCKCGKKHLFLHIHASKKVKGLMIIIVKMNMIVHKKNTKI